MCTAKGQRYDNTIQINNTLYYDYPYSILNYHSVIPAQFGLFTVGMRDLIEHAILHLVRECW